MSRTWRLTRPPSRSLTRRHSRQMSHRKRISKPRHAPRRQPRSNRQRHSASACRACLQDSASGPPVVPDWHPLSLPPVRRTCRRQTAPAWSSMGLLTCPTTCPFRNSMLARIHRPIPIRSPRRPKRHFNSATTQQPARRPPKRQALSRSAPSRKNKLSKRPLKPWKHNRPTNRRANRRRLLQK